MASRENSGTHQRSQSPHLKHHLQLKIKEDGGGQDMRLQRGGIGNSCGDTKADVWFKKKKKSLRDQAETEGYQEEF